MYSAHNRHYGIVFNSSHVHPTIEEAYPLPKLHHWLSEREEEAAFAEFQRQKLARLQQLLRKGFPLDKDDESLRQRLLIGLFPLPAIDELTDLGALEGRSHPLLQQLNLSPLQREWELMTMEERMSHMPPGRRTLPRPGDRLLAINGQLVRQGVRAKSLGGWDHSETLRMLEHVGSTDPQYSTPPRWDERMMATVLSRQLWECEDISRLDVHPLTWTKLESAPTGMRLELGCEGQACLSKALERETSSHPSTTAITLSRKEYLQLGLSNVPGRSHYIELTEVRRGWRYLKPAADSISRASYYVVARVQLPGRKLAESITSRKQYPYLSARVDVDLHLGTSQHLDEQVRDSSHISFGDGKMFMPIVELPCCVTHYDRYNEQPHAMAGASACERVLHDLALDTLSGVGMIDDKDQNVVHREAVSARSQSTTLTFGKMLLQGVGLRVTGRTNACAFGLKTSH
ncbi:hypothetical protein AB1Y20_018542 [Prymnesium parvum]|uniref:Uncharacterized protein n=1 Tax=Prymnesium parvum TaxID=97485 RepID=A0AB34JS81_PRYPA